MSNPPPMHRAPLWEGLQVALLAVNLIWTTLCLGGYRPETMVVTGGLTCALLTVHLASRVAWPAARAHPAGWMLVSFLAYAAINAEWVSPVHWLGWRDWIGWAQLAAVFWVVLNGIHSRSARWMLFLVLVTLGVIAAALACYQRFVRPDWLMLGRTQVNTFLPRASGPFGSPNSLAALLVMLIPSAGALAWRAKRSIGARAGWSVVCGVMAVGLVLTISRGAWIGLALALVAWPLMSSRWSWRRRVVVALAVVIAVAAMGAALFMTSASIRERMIHFARDRGETTRQILWRAAWQISQEHPIVGSGAGSFNVVFEKYRPEGFLNDPQWAHNDYLNTLSDYGVVGFLLFFGGAAVIVWQCGRSHRSLRGPPENGESNASGLSGAIAVGMLAFAFQLFVDFHLKIPALAMAFATLGALVVQRRWPRQESEVSAVAGRRLRPGVAAIGVIGFGVGFVIPHFRSEALRYDSRQLIDQLANSAVAPDVYRAILTRARSELAGAVSFDPSNAQAWADKSCADALWAHVEPDEINALGISAEIAANRALTLSSVPSEFWVRRGVARDLQNRWVDAGADLGHALERTPRTALIWYYYAYHLSLKSSQRGLAEAAIGFCLRLDPGNGPGLALRHHLAISKKTP